MVEILFWGLALTVVYTYVGFPLLLGLAAGLRPKPVRRSAVTPSLSLVIVAHNEEEVIARKLANSRELDYPPELLQVVVASDGSSDRTVAEARRADPEALVLDLPRVGKAKALNRAVESCAGEVLVLSDANAMYDKEALRELAADFADPGVGGVCGNMIAESRGGSFAGRGEQLYWRYDKWLKRNESRLGSIVSADGSIYALRRSLFRPVEDFVTDDFVISVRVVEQGYRLIFERNAISREPVLSRSRDQLKRRVRIVEAALRGMFLVRHLMNPFDYGSYAWVLISHKLLRRMIPIFLVILLALSIALSTSGPFYRLFLVAQLVLYLAALAGMMGERLGWRPRPLLVPYYFCLGNWGTLVGWYMVLRHHRRETLWVPIRDRSGSSVRGNE